LVSAALLGSGTGSKTEAWAALDDLLQNIGSAGRSNATASKVAHMNEKPARRDESKELCRAASKATREAARRQSEAARREAARKRDAWHKPVVSESRRESSEALKDVHVEGQRDEYLSAEEKASRAAAAREAHDAAEEARKRALAQEKARWAEAVREERARKMVAREALARQKAARAYQARLAAEEAMQEAKRAANKRAGISEAEARRNELYRQARARHTHPSSRPEQHQRHEEAPATRRVFKPLPSDKGMLVQQVLTLREDPFLCLGLPKGSSHERARRRYLQLALALHPDKCSHHGARDAFEAVQHSYRTIQSNRSCDVLR